MECEEGATCGCEDMWSVRNVAWRMWTWKCEDGHVEVGMWVVRNVGHVECGNVEV